MATVNLSKNTFRQGVSSYTRVIEVLNILWNVATNKSSADIIYFTVSESLAGNLKDLLIYSICWGRLDKMVIHLHGGAGMRVIMSKKHPLLRLVNAFVLRRLGAVIVLGDRLKAIYNGVLPLSILHAVPNFAANDLFVTLSDIEKKFVRVEPLRLLFLSNLLPGKGHQELLAALAQLPSEVCQIVQVDFAGGFQSVKEETNFYTQVLAIKNIRINVHGIVYGEQKRELLRKAHLFCLPTYYPYEGQPISILEAYASGCSVMTTDHSGIFDIFTPGVNGIEVRPRSPESIAQAIQYAWKHTQSLFEHAKNNHKQAIHKYRASTHIEAIEKIILSIEHE